MMLSLALIGFTLGLLTSLIAGYLGYRQGYMRGWSDGRIGQKYRFIGQGAPDWDKEGQTR